MRKTDLKSKDVLIRTDFRSSTGKGHRFLIKCTYVILAVMIVEMKISCSKKCDSIDFHNQR